MRERSATSRWLDADAVLAVVSDVNALVQRSAAATALETGRLLFERIFNGDVELVERRGRRLVGFRALSGHPDLALSRRQLWQSLRLYILRLSLPPTLWEQLGWQQQLALCGAPTPARLPLAERASAESWTARRLTREIASSPTQGGGSTTPVGRRTGAWSHRPFVG